MTPAETFTEVMLKDPDEDYKALLESKRQIASRQGNLVMVRYYRDLLAALSDKEQSK